MRRPEDRPGRRLAGRYELIEPAGTGGMAVVWRAIAHGGDGGPGKQVAIKRMLPALSRDPEFMEMFAEEARIVAALRDPHIVAVHDFLADEKGAHFIVMEWVEGLDLGRLVQGHRQGGRRVPWGPLAALGAQVLRGLEAGHARRDGSGRPAPVFHRDVTPSNVLVGRDGVTKLADFGLARAMDRVTITGPGIIKGKLAYVAPELVSGQRASAQSDLYSLGVVLWEALAGRRLHEGKNDIELFVSVGRGEVPPLGTVRGDLPEALVETVERALAPSPRRRFDSAGAMAAALQELATAHSIGTEEVGEAVRVAEAHLDGIDPTR